MVLNNYISVKSFEEKYFYRFILSTSSLRPNKWVECKGMYVDLLCLKNLKLCYLT